jgi:hypothetical protein
VIRELSRTVYDDLRGRWLSSIAEMPLIAEEEDVVLLAERLVANHSDHDDPMSAPDALIAAAAISTDRVLITENWRDFHFVKGLQFVDIRGVTSTEIPVVRFRPARVAGPLADQGCCRRLARAESRQTWDVRDAIAAKAVVSDFWSALAADDDGGAIDATSSAVHDQIGLDAGFCERLRDALNVDGWVCMRIGISSKVRIVGGRMIFVGAEVDPDEDSRILGYLGPQRIPAWPLWMVLERGRWKVGGVYASEDGTWPADTLYLDLPGAPGPDGPIN